ncbi:MAG: polynucleotide adenylyltransferase PcnB, partial [Treponema sp.]|nr:polynucleotide adenylyltransferase PcnB [Treponema sp.]
AELYKGAFAMARKFVLPMNPPRVELDMALKSLFAEHGLQVKKPRYHIEKAAAKSRRHPARAVSTD